MKDLKDITGEMSINEKSFLIGRYDISRPSHKALQDSFYEWFHEAKKKLRLPNDIFIEMLNCMETELMLGELE